MRSQVQFFALSISHVLRKVRKVQGVNACLCVRTCLPFPYRENCKLLTITFIFICLSMATMNEKWSKITRFMDQRDLAIHLDTIFNHTELVKILSSLGLSYPGMRLSSIPQYELLDALVDELYDNPQTGKKIIKIIEKKVSTYLKKISQMEIPALRNYLNNVVKKGPAIKEISINVLTLMLDERKEVTEQLAWFLDKVMKKKRKKEFDYEDLIAKEKQLVAQLKDKEDINKKLSQALASSNMENKKLNKELSKTKKEMQDLRAELDQLKSLAQQPTQAVEVKHLEKNFDKIVYSLDKILQNEKNMASFQERIEETILRIFSEAKNSINELRKDSDKSYRELKNTMIEKLKNFTASLKVIPKEEPKKNTQERVAVFVDGENLYWSAKENFNGKVNYEKLLALAVGANRYLVKAFVYVVKSIDGDVRPFIQSLAKMGYEPKIKDPRIRSDGSVKANWDMGIALDIIFILDKVDTIILATGDGDFVPLVNHIKSKGKRVEVYSFPDNTAYDLKELADFFYPLDEKIALV